MKIAFVTPWYGEIPGGAESETRETARRLAAAGLTVEVITTCIRDFFAPWDKNFHRAGVTFEDGVTVRRFKVRRRDYQAFAAVNATLMAGGGISAENEQTYLHEMFKSPALLHYLAQHHADYQLLFFIPYMFATTVLGCQIAPERSIIIPCLHDEAYARLGIFRDSLPHARAMILHSNTEKRLADQLWGESAQTRLVLGEGVQTDFVYDATRFRKKYGVEKPFVLWVGRRSAGKGTPLLLKHWRQFVRENPTDLQLVLIGPGELSNLPAQTIDLGFVPIQDKYDAMAAALAFVHPSPNESFSLVLMESWVAGTPALVNGKTAVLHEHCVRSNGGLWWENGAEFAATLNYLMANPTSAAQMAANGRQYVLENYQWETITAKYVELIESLGKGVVKTK